MRPGPRGKRGWAFSGEPKRAAERTCRRRVGWLAAALVCEETITKLNEDIKEGGPFPASAYRTRVCSASGARRGSPAHHPQNVAPLRMAGDPHFARTTAASSPVPAPSSSSATHARPVRFPLAAHQRLSATRESLSWCPVRRRIARGAGEPPRAYSSWSSGSGVWPPSRRNSRRAASTSA